MQFVVRLHAEITIKSRSVRKRHGKVLTNNLKKLLRPLDDSLYVKWLWDRIAVKADGNDPQLRAAIIERLQCVPGVSWFTEVIEQPVSDFATLADWVCDHWAEKLVNKSFAVRVKRKGHHDFSSQDLQRYLGGALLRNAQGSSVKLKDPEVDVSIQVTDKVVHILGDRYQGLGGFPIPTQETVLSLMSGGFDSSVASFEFIRRGARTHFCFFNLGGDAHEVAVRQIAYFLWQKYSASHPIKFVSVDFGPVVEDILQHVDNGQMGVVLKRQMLRAASKVARFTKARALVTGEAMGQVSSQTLANLQVIDQATDTLVLRPLITMDKQDIVDRAKQIGTEALAKSIPEYCGVISNKPTVMAQPEVVAQEEAKLDPELIDTVVRAAQVLSMEEIGEQAKQQAGTVTRLEDSEGAVVIDIRAPEEEDEAPLEIDREVVCIPFYQLARKFAELDQQQRYLLYCQQGVMSRMQALLLQEEGYTNVAVYEGE